MSNDDSLLGGPLNLPGGGEQRPTRSRNLKLRTRGKRSFVVIGTVLTIIILGSAGWLVFGRNSTSPSVTSEAEANAGTPAGDQESVGDELPDTSDTKIFKSDHPRIELSYPSYWTVTEKDGGVRIESSEFDYATTSGTTTTGVFRIYIRQGARSVDSKYIGRGVAVEPSEKLTYAQPAPGQRTETNLTHFGLDTPDAFDYFLIAGNYSLQKGDTLGPNYGKEAESYIISGGYSATDLNDDLATNQVPLDRHKQSKAYMVALEIIKSLKLY